MDVHDCTVTGAGDTSVTAQNGIQVSYGAGGTIDDCDVDAIRYTGATYASAGILVYLAGSSMDIGGANVITNNQLPVRFIDADGSISGCTVPDGSGDDIATLLVENYGGVARRAAALPAAHPVEESHGASRSEAITRSVSVSGNTLSGTGLAASVGVYAYTLGDDLNLSVSGNTITDWDYGVFLGENVIRNRRRQHDHRQPDRGNRQLRQRIHRRRLLQLVGNGGRAERLAGEPLVG